MRQCAFQVRYVGCNFVSDGCNKMLDAPATIWSFAKCAIDLTSRDNGKRVGSTHPFDGVADVVVRDNGAGADKHVLVRPEIQHLLSDLFSQLIASVFPTLLVGITGAGTYGPPSIHSPSGVNA